jgi:hypothetical protein
VKLSAPTNETSYNPITSVPISYDTNDTLFRNADGSETKEVSPTPINVKGADGSWTAAGTSVSTDAQSGGYKVADNPLNPRFAQTLGTGADVTVNSGSDPVSMSLVGASSAPVTRPSAAELHSSNEGLGGDQSAVSSAVVYPNAFPGQELQYQVTTSEVKETLVLDSASSVAQSSWSWLIHAPGLTMSQSDRSSLYLTDTNGVVQYSIPDPIMWDSSGVAQASGPALVDVPFAFAQTTDGDWELTLTPDPTWLADPSRMFPVMIDPTMATGPTTFVAYESTGPSVANDTRVGNSRSGGDTEWRTVVCYPYTSVVPAHEIMPNSQIGYNYLAGTTSTQPGFILFATAFSFSGAGQYISSWSTGSGGGATSGSDQGLSNQYQAWDNAGFTPACLMITGNEVPGSYTYKELNTALFLNYEDTPPAPAISPVSPVGGVHASIMPTLSVNTTANPAGGADNYSFEVSTNSNPDVSPIWTSNGFTTSSP